MKPKFDIELLPEAVQFLDNLDDKAREKIYYNLKKAQLVTDNELFKKLNESCGNFGQFTTAKLTDFFFLGQSKWKGHFGHSNARNFKKDSKDTSERNQKSRRNKKTIFKI